MRTISKLSPLAVAVSLGASALALPTVASAEVSASFAASNFYLFRGANLSGSAPAVSGSLDYSHDSGLYAGIWASSEGDTDSASGTDTGVSAGSGEYDLYVGFAGEAGDFGYDVAIVSYAYPDSPTPVSYSSLAEIIIGLSLADFSLTIVDQIQSGNGGYMYYNLGYAMGDFGINYGITTSDASGFGAEPTHLDVSYAATDELSFVVSKVIDNDFDGVNDPNALFNLTYSKSFDL